MAKPKTDHKGLLRIMLNKELIPYLKKCRGSCLDTGGAYSPYKKYLNVKKYYVLDISSEFHPDFIADVHDMHIIKNNSMDSIIATELLEHCYDPQKVLDEFYRVLRKKGTVVLSVPFLFPYHPDPKDYFRFTKDGLKYLFRKYSKVEIIGYGSRFAFNWEMMTWILPFMKIFNSAVAKINFNDKNGRCGFIVFAEK